MKWWYSQLFFFFQAEDGIRDLIVTGVQTCALPISPGTRDILTNPDVIAVDQDSLGVQGMLVREGPPELQVWAKRLKDGARAVALLNREIGRASCRERV